MQRRRELMAMQSELPSVYRKVEWIECSGGQIIVLGIVPTVSDIVETEYAQNNVAPRSSPVYFTLYSAGDGTYQFVTVAQIGTSGVYYTWGRYFSNTASENWTYTSNMPSPTDYVWFKHRVNGNTQAQSCTILENGISFWKSSPFLTDTLSGSNTNLQLFARTGSTSNYFIGRMRTFSITRNNAKIVNLIPCVRKSDSKPGMYDTVSKTFYTNAGIGELIVPA